MREYTYFKKNWIGSYIPEEPAGWRDFTNTTDGVPQYYWSRKPALLIIYPPNIRIIYSSYQRIPVEGGGGPIFLIYNIIPSFLLLLAR